ncbi:hypothetical protein PEDI_39530 [Persicobacter diffluens]|uniref:Uncharacterized protein n=1 Tax=Persicobacter diffluens TaxID=981 RepID=A0AAN5ANJ6_9BACT|nr:hypothetical protein PEDI_39530 [Persicobacter diffluens]
MIFVSPLVFYFFASTFYKIIPFDKKEVFKILSNFYKRGSLMLGIKPVGVGWIFMYRYINF